MKKSVCILFIFILCIAIENNYAQNLVPNYSFEIYSTCPNAGGQINYSTPWKNPTTTTSDYFNSCSLSYGVPLNGIGHQNAIDGVAYGGFTAFANPLGSNFREYLQVPLTTALSIDSCYHLSFYVSIADSAVYGTNKLSAFFSDTAISASCACFLTCTPQIIFYSPTVIGNSSTWYKVEGIFQAQGNEQYLTIGNFSTDASTTITSVNPGEPFDIAYYYIDSVSLIKVTCPIDIGINENSKQNPLFDLSPNPNEGNMVLSYHLNQNEKAEIKIYDITGKLMGTYNVDASAGKMEINNDQLSNGTYFCQIALNGQIVQFEKLIIIK